MEFGLTGESNIDKDILLLLDDEDLLKACETDKYTNILCSTDDFWKEKIRSLDLEANLCNECKTFKESYFVYKKYLNSHGFLLKVESLNIFYNVFSTIEDAYEAIVKILMDISEDINNPDNPVTRNMFPNIYNVENILKSHKDGILKFNKTFDILLDIFEYGITRKQGDPYIMAMENVSLLGHNIMTPLTDFLGYKFKLPNKISVLDLSSLQHTVYKHDNVEILEKLANEYLNIGSIIVRDTEFSIYTVNFYIIDTKTQTQTKYTIQSNK